MSQEIVDAVREIERELPRSALVEALRPEREKAGGNGVLGALFHIVAGEQVAGDLFA